MQVMQIMKYATIQILHILQIRQTMQIVLIGQTLVFFAFRFLHGDKSAYKFFSFACRSFVSILAFIQASRCMFANPNCERFHCQQFLVVWNHIFHLAANNVKTHSGEKSNQCNHCNARNLSKTQWPLLMGLNQSNSALQHKLTNTHAHTHTKER